MFILPNVSDVHGRPSSEAIQVQWKKRQKLVCSTRPKNMKIIIRILEYNSQSTDGKYKVSRTMDEQTKMKQQKNVIKLSGKNKQRVSKLKMQFVLKDGYV